MAEESLKRNIFQRILGIPATKQPVNSECWKFSDGNIEIDLSKAPELSEKGKGFSIEGEDLPDRILVFQGVDNNYYAVINKCEHAGRRLDPLTGSEKIQCCSIGKTTYDYDGNVISGNVKGSLKMYPIEKNEDRLIVKIG
jgi:nitrite reductase/ring-hydroxylating ferredoxin subunit